MRLPSPRLQTAAGLLLLIACCAATAAAQTQVARDVVASGGTAMGSPSFGVLGTVGQPGTGALSGTNTSVLAGF